MKVSFSSSWILFLISRSAIIAVVTVPVVVLADGVYICHLDRIGILQTKGEFTNNTLSPWLTDKGRQFFDY